MFPLLLKLFQRLVTSFLLQPVLLPRVAECRKVCLCESGPALCLHAPRPHTRGQTESASAWVPRRPFGQMRKKMVPILAPPPFFFLTIWPSETLGIRPDISLPPLWCPSSPHSAVALYSGKPTEGRASRESGRQREVCLLLLARPALDCE